MHASGMIHQLDEKLHQWSFYKRSENYSDADRIRTWLRARGVQPDARTVVMSTHANVNDLLDVWQAAKKRHDYVLADALRARLKHGKDQRIRRMTAIGRESKHLADHLARQALLV